MSNFDLFNPATMHQIKQRRSPAAPETPKPPKAPEIDDLDKMHAKWVQTQNPELLRNMVDQMNKPIDNAMTSYVGAPSPIMRARARKIAADAVKSYDPKSGASLKNWVAVNLQGLRRYANTTGPIQVPERIRLDNSRIYQVTQEFSNEHGRPPSDDEVADLTGLPIKRINYVRKMSMPIVAEGKFLSGSDSDEDDVYMPGVAKTDYRNIWAEYVYHDLDPVNKQIYDMRVGRGQFKGAPLPVHEISRRLNISSAAVSQRSNKIADKLGEGYGMEGAL